LRNCFGDRVRALRRRLEISQEELGGKVNGARQKLNQSYFCSSLLVAALVGWVAQFWPVFLLALTVLVECNLYCNEIRPAKRGSRKPTSQ
jgi:transcriptional regulator with XRE-family HTH domain